MNDLISVGDVLAVRGDPASTEVRSIEFDSRSVAPGALFCCVPGATTDGHDHAPDAVRRGATALLCERFLDLEVTQARVAPGAVRPAMARMAAALYGYPSRALTTVGVTGTNGKTTVTQLVRSVLERAGRPTAAIGTLAGARTTPEAPVLQRMLDELKRQGKVAVAMEVSSHALTQHRVDGMVFDVAAFTNLSRDHLDHHGTMESYFAAKATLFDPERCRLAVVNVDDRWGRRLADGLDGVPLIPVRRAEAADITLGVGTSTFVWRGHRVTIPLSGAFNVDNALMAAAVATALGVDEPTVVEGLAGAAPVPGRMELVPAADAPVSVFVDYAHTPAGLEVALTAARALAGAARVICVFGCGGDRDPGKRPEMGAVAARGADVVVLTSDNPRSEDPDAIIGQIRAGMTEAPAPVVEPDRAAAIRTAVGLAHPGDVVLLAGKGHETSQTGGGVPLPFDDRVEAGAALAERFGGTHR
jgi:UDP-N-acetylmuramoyl-L-alanyl-D-glutamate--2,6-diaminopimelate ligase